MSAITATVGIPLMLQTRLHHTLTCYRSRTTGRAAWRIAACGRQARSADRRGEFGAWVRRKSAAADIAVISPSLHTLLVAGGIPERK